MIKYEWSDGGVRLTLRVSLNDITHKDGVGVLYIDQEQFNEIRTSNPENHSPAVIVVVEQAKRVDVHYEATDAVVIAGGACEVYLEEDPMLIRSGEIIMDVCSSDVKLVMSEMKSKAKAGSLIAPWKISEWATRLENAL